MTNGLHPLIATSATPHLAGDTFLNGRLTVYQHKTGYRFSIDAILLAGYVRPKAGDRLIDLGCGCGIIALILAHRYPNLQLFGVEIQPAVHVEYQQGGHGFDESALGAFHHRRTEVDPHTVADVIVVVVDIPRAIDHRVD